MEDDHRQQRQDQGVRAVSAQVLPQRHLDRADQHRHDPCEQCRPPCEIPLPPDRSRCRSRQPGSAAPRAAAGATAPEDARRRTVGSRQAPALRPAGAPRARPLSRCAASGERSFARRFSSLRGRRRLSCRSAYRPSPRLPSRLHRAPLARASATAPVAIRHGVRSQAGVRCATSPSMLAPILDFYVHANSARRSSHTRRPGIPGSGLAGPFPSGSTPPPCAGSCARSPTCSSSASSSTCASPARASTSSCATPQARSHARFG